MDSLTIESNITRNLIQLGLDRGYPVPFSSDDVDEVLSSDSSLLDKLNTIRRIKAAVHEVLYAPPGH